MNGLTSAHLIYASGIMLALVFRYVLPSALRVPAEQVRLLAPVLLGVALMDYGLSLWLERRLLAASGGTTDPPAQEGRQRPVVAPIITAALGASIALYGGVLWLLGAGARWWAVLLGLACLHWLHSFLRWSQWEETPAPRD